MDDKKSKWSNKIKMTDKKFKMADAK